MYTGRSWASVCLRMGNKFTIFIQCRGSSPSSFNAMTGYQFELFKYLMLNDEEAILSARTCVPVAMLKEPNFNNKQHKISSWQRFSAGQTESCALIVVNCGHNHEAPQSNKLNHQTQIQNP